MQAKSGSCHSLGKVVHQNTFFFSNTGKLSANELRLLLYVISQIPSVEIKSATDIPAIVIPTKSLAQVLNFTGSRQSWTTRLKEISDGLVHTLASVKTNTGRLATTWFEYVYYIESADSYIFQLSQSLAPFLLQLTKQFTVYELGYVFLLTKPHSIRLYDILKGFAYQESFEISLEDLRLALGLVNLDENGEIASFKSPTYKALQKDVLDPSLKDINNTTDLDVSFDPVISPTGRHVTTGLIFHVKPKQNIVPIFDKWSGIRTAGVSVRVKREDALKFVDNSIQVALEANSEGNHQISFFPESTQS